MSRRAISAPAIPGGTLSSAMTKSDLAGSSCLPTGSGSKPASRRAFASSALSRDGDNEIDVLRNDEGGGNVGLKEIRNLRAADHDPGNFEHRLETLQRSEQTVSKGHEMSIRSSDLVDNGVDDFVYDVDSVDDDIDSVDDGIDPVSDSIGPVGDGIGPVGDSIAVFLKQQPPASR